MRSFDFRMTERIHVRNVRLANRWTPCSELVSHIEEVEVGDALHMSLVISTRIFERILEDFYADSIGRLASSHGRRDSR